MGKGGAGKGAKGAGKGAAAEKRVDAEDGASYTFEELSAFYNGKYKKSAVQEYWDGCKPAKAAKGAGKGKAAAEPKAKAKAKAKVKAKARPEKKEDPNARKPASAEEVIKRFSDCCVIPVIKITDIKQAVPLAQALKDGGVDVVEITFRTDCAADAIREVCKNVEGVSAAAGTVLTAKQVDEAVDAGSDCVISPGFSAAVLKRCQQRGVLYLPAVITPTEIMEVTSRHKLTHLKFFPASNFGGAGTLKGYGAVFPNITFMPTGGVTEENIRTFTSMPNIMAAGGSWFVSDALVDKATATGDWSPITEAARKAQKAAKGL